MMAVARWMWGTALSLVLLAVIPYRREGPMAVARWMMQLALMVCFALWLVSAAGKLLESGRTAHPISMLTRARRFAWLAIPLALLGLWLRAAHRARTPLVLRESASRAAVTSRLEQRVRHLATHIGERHVNGYREALDAAAAWIMEEFRRTGWPAQQEAFVVRLGDADVRVANILAERRGMRRPTEVVLVGAHYDTYPGTPGANDNASGVAALLELADRLRHVKPNRTLRLIAFVNEEPPFFMTADMGSEVHARGVAARGERVVVMMALETIGCYRGEPGSQQYPTPILHLFYPSRGHFVGLVGGLNAIGALRRTARAMRRATEVPVLWAALPMFVTGVSWSDHWPFARRGIPALMITDTAPFRYPWYHQPEDRPEALNYAAMAAVLDGLEAAVRDWSE